MNKVVYLQSVNEKEIALKSHGKAQMEGRLNYKKNNPSSYYQPVFKERWFKLIDNCLFYFRIADTGTVNEKEPAGLIVMENASVQIEDGYEIPFAFSISFFDEPDRKHLFSGMNESTVSQWVAVLRCTSYEYLRSKLHVLQSQIYLKTGMDPLLMVPRNEGSKKWAPGEPLPSEIIHHDKFNNSQMTTHHTNVLRSKSSASVFHKTNRNGREVERVVEGRSSVGLERSRTTVNVFTRRHNPFNSSEFFDGSSSSSVTHLRPAPSPPSRKRSSPKNIVNTDTQFNPSLDNMILFNDQENLKLPPRPPSRRNSPRRTPLSGQSERQTPTNVISDTSSDTGDLIQF